MFQIKTSFTLFVDFSILIVDSYGCRYSNAFEYDSLIPTFRGVQGFRVSRNAHDHILACVLCEIAIAIAMAAATMATATATTRLAILSPRACTNFSRNGAVLRLGASVAAAGSLSISCALAAFGVLQSSDMKAALLARAAEIGNGEVATEEVEAPVAEEASEEVEAAVVEIPQVGSKLYVGNLPWSCDSEQLAGILRGYGAVEVCEVIYEQETGRSRGFAFVTMASNEDAQAVVNALDGSELGGRVLRVNFPKPTRSNPRVVRPGRKRPGNVNKVFVGNLPWACNEEALTHLFSDHGKVVEATVVYNKETGRSRGFGFVTMDSAEEVNIAIENLNGTEFEGRQLRVDQVENKLPPRQGSL